MVSRPVQRTLVELFLDDHERTYEVSLFVVFAALLAVFLFRHAMYFDEVQAWQIARHSHGVPDLAFHLRYEGHPALWYLFLYLPAHFSKNIVWMQAINYCMALTTCALVVSDRRISLAARSLVVFSASIFFYMGVVSRSYMLAGLLLIAAARCLREEQDRHWRATVLLGLAVNTHFLAIPIAMAIFAKKYWDRRDRQQLHVQCRRSWKTISVLALSLLICFLTVRPASDLATPQYDGVGFSPFRFLVLGVGGVWRFLVYIPARASSNPIVDTLMRPSIADPMLSFLILLLALIALPTRSGRVFMAISTTLWIAAVWMTVHSPTAFHFTFLSVAYIIAMTFRTEEKPIRPLFPQLFGHVLLIMFLSSQSVLCLSLLSRELTTPFSAAKATAEWLEANHLSNRPLVFTPDTNAPAVLGYLARDSAYFPACHCSGPFVVFRRGRDPYLHLTSGESRSLEGIFGSSPVLVSSFRLGKSEVDSLGMDLLYTSQSGTWGGENVNIYCRRTSLRDSYK